MNQVFGKCRKCGETHTGPCKKTEAIGLPKNELHTVDWNAFQKELILATIASGKNYAYTQAMAAQIQSLTVETLPELMEKIAKAEAVAVVEFVNEIMRLCGRA